MVRRGGERQRGEEWRGPRTPAFSVSTSVATAATTSMHNSTTTAFMLKREQRTRKVRTTKNTRRKRAHDRQREAGLESALSKENEGKMAREVKNRFLTG